MQCRDFLGCRTRGRCHWAGGADANKMGSRFTITGAGAELENQRVVVQRSHGRLICTPRTPCCPTPVPRILPGRNRRQGFTEIGILSQEELCIVKGGYTGLKLVRENWPSHRKKLEKPASFAERTRRKFGKRTFVASSSGSNSSAITEGRTPSKKTH